MTDTIALVRRALPLVVVGLALVATPGAMAKPGALFGFSDSALERGHPPQAVLPLLDRTGASVYRMDVRWDYVEPRLGEWRWAGYDRTYRALRAGGVRPLVVVRSAPGWAQDDGSILGALIGHREGPPSPEHLSDWGEFVRRVAERYPGLAGIEVFNEPNYAVNNWRPRADPSYYTSVLRSANAAVKSARPGMPVLFGGLLNVSDSELPVNMSPERFLSEAYVAGARGQMDAIAIHPYVYLYRGSPADPRSPYRQMLAGMRRVRDSAGDRRTPFWITETGYPTASPDVDGVSPEGQANRLTEIARLGLSEPDVDAVLLYSLIDHGEDPYEVEHGFGVVRTDLTPKPALAAIAAVTGAPRLSLSPTWQRFRARGRRQPRLTLAITESARVTFTVKRARRGRRPAVRSFRRVLGKGRHRVRPLVRRGRKGGVRRGVYVVSARATDPTGERSAVRSVRIRVVR